MSDSTLIALQILDKVVKDASLYTTMKTPGPVQPYHFFPPFSGELVLLALPDVVSYFFHSDLYSYLFDLF